jgi:hypothetical protein
MWPKQKECSTFYGDPRSPGFANKLVSVTIPWMCVMDTGATCKHITVHPKCAQSLQGILNEIWDVSGHSQDKINEWGMNVCAGGYSYRLMRGGSSLSMHSYGCAVDFDPARNGFGDDHPHFADCPEVLKAFEGERWTWGGNWHKKDGMHWQAAEVT